MHDIYRLRWFSGTSVARDLWLHCCRIAITTSSLNRFLGELLSCMGTDFCGKGNFLTCCVQTVTQAITILCYKMAERLNIKERSRMKSFSVRCLEHYSLPAFVPNAFSCDSIVTEEGVMYRQIQVRETERDRERER